jgi:DNA-binding Xre family transcriptional regulator
MTAAEYAEKAGKNLRQIMYDKQVTQAQLSHDLKISKATVSSWATGKRLPRAGAMDKICRYLQCTREDILDGPKEPISKKTVPTGDKAEIPNFSPEAMQLVEYINGNENLRLLLVAAVGCPPEDIKLAVDVLWGLKHARQTNTR